MTLKDIKVGDIVQMKYCSICPFDLLILDTSEQRYNDNILKTNERKLKGENRVRIKRAVRNFDIRNNSQVVNSREYLTKLSKKMNGYLEYD